MHSVSPSASPTSSATLQLRRTRTLSLVQVHIAALLAGCTGLFAKFVVTHPVLMTCVRTVFGLLTLAAIAWIAGTSLRLRSVRDAVYIAVAGAFLAVHWILFFHSIQVSTVAVGVLALSTFPLFITFLEPLIFRERLYASDILAAVLVVAGVSLVTPDWSWENNHTQGVFWGILSALAVVAVSLLTRHSIRAADYPSLTVAFYQQVAATLCLLPVVAGLSLGWWGADPASASVRGRDFVLLVVLGVIFTGILQWMLVSGLRTLRAQTVGVILSLEPLYSIALAALLLSETPSGRTLAGGVLIFGAVAWTSLRRRHD